MTRPDAEEYEPAYVLSHVNLKRKVEGLEVGKCCQGKIILEDYRVPILIPTVVWKTIVEPGFTDMEQP